MRKLCQSDLLNFKLTAGLSDGVQQLSDVLLWLSLKVLICDFYAQEYVGFKG